MNFIKRNLFNLMYISILKIFFRILILVTKAQQTTTLHVFHESPGFKKLEYQ